MKKSVRILLVEDNELDVRMILHSANKTKLRNNFTVVNDGMSALELLRQTQDAELPDLVLLDLSLPGITGMELLQTVKQDPRLRKITVVVLTSSAATSDIKLAYDSYAAAFITKPIDVLGFTEIVSAIDDFFFEIVTLPEIADE